MDTTMTLRFALAAVLMFVAQLGLFIGSVIYLVKKKSAAGWLLVIASLLLLTARLLSPVMNIFFAKQLEGALNLAKAQGVISVFSGFFELIFVFGFLWAIIKLKK